jgi:DNA-binding response OmpR family regulator
MGQIRLNFGGVTALLIDRSHYCRSLVAQMLRGFGMQAIISCESGAEAQEQLRTSHIDLCLVEADLPDMSGADLIRWMRREQKDPLRFVPIIVLSGYTQRRMLSANRDAGANLLLKKPLSAQAIFDRIAWVARTSRSFIETGNYVGPDRRFRQIVPPDKTYKREDDNASNIGSESLKPSVDDGLSRSSLQ